MEATVLTDRLAEIKKEVEKQKVQLTPEVREYMEKHIARIQEKLGRGKAVKESDLSFIETIKEWISLSDKYRKTFPDLEAMLISDKMKEAKKRDISFEQWLDLLHVAEAAEEYTEWIDQTFQFPGRGKINVRGNLDLGGCGSLTSLPEGLSVGTDLNLIECSSLTSLPEGLSIGGSLDLSVCHSLSSLPEGLSVGRNLNLYNCLSLTTLPKGLSVRRNLELFKCTRLKELPSELSVGGNLDLRYCSSLASLPEGLSVGEDLNLRYCSSLTRLPEELSVGEDLNLSMNLLQQVKDDAIRLKKEGRIKGEIKYQ